MTDWGRLFGEAAAYGAEFRSTLGERAVRAELEVAEAVDRFAGELPSAGVDPAQVVRELISAAEPGLTASAGPRYFGFVVGGALPGATAAEMLTAAWDQNAFNATLSPAAVAAEQVAGVWLKDLLRVPPTASVGFVTGAQAANTAGLAAARHHVLAEAGWEVERDGLIGAPRVRVVAGIERHATVDRSLRLLGLGTGAIEPVAATADGGIDVSDLAKVLRAGSGPVIVCLQSGNVNTGACDDLRAATELAHEHGAWVHVDGAFGLWAAASPRYSHLVDGVELADSWGCDGHKWLNVPYDSAFALCSRPEVHAAAMSYAASYLEGAGRLAAAADLAAESSRRARGFAVWAALRELGRQGVSGLVERCCELARRFADGLRGAGFEIPHEVHLNQVLVGFGDDARTDAVIAAVQRGGVCWMGGTTWRGRRWMRISVSNHTTTESDVDRSIAAVLAAAR